MIERLLLAHVAVALAVGLVSAAARGRPFRPSWGVPDAILSLALPVLGPLIALAALVFERAFRRRGLRSTELDAASDEPAAIRELDPLEELRVGTAVAPVSEILAIGDLEEIDRTLRRLIDSDRPAVLRLLKDALQSPRLEVRVRARGLLVRAEDRLLTRARDAEDPLERARASHKLAGLCADAATARQHLGDAARSCEESLAADPSSAAGALLGRLLLQLGEVERAREILTLHLRNHPDDTDARLVRAQASLRLSDVAAARRDCAALDLPALE
jgi:predicted Zn-dependent protease